MIDSKVFERLGIIRRPKLRIPKHIAVTIDGMLAWQKRNKSKDRFLKRDEVIRELVEQQVDLAIPILTLSLYPENRGDSDELTSLKALFASLKRNRLVHANQIKVSVLGKWYDLPGSLVEEIKDLIDETKSYDRFFLNFCVNYDGQEEIVDACKLICRRVVAGRMDISSISRESVKDNLYSSYFLPPDLLIKTGERRTWSTLLLWDCATAHYFHTGRPFNDLTSSDIGRAIAEYQ
jgi:undecaprenyl diphosphate synthase